MRLPRALLMSPDSNTVAVHFQSDSPKSLAEAMELFSAFGDIVRLDITVPSRVIASFFDVRDAQKVLQHFGVLAEPFPAAEHDFRAVSIPLEAASGLRRQAAQLRRQVAQLRGYGEIAGVFLCLCHSWVTFRIILRVLKPNKEQTNSFFIFSQP